MAVALGAAVEVLAGALVTVAAGAAAVWLPAQAASHKASGSARALEASRAARVVIRLAWSANIPHFGRRRRYCSNSQYEN